MTTRQICQLVLGAGSLGYLGFSPSAGALEAQILPPRVVRVRPKVQQEAADWAKVFLAPAHLPPKGLQYVLLPGDGRNLCDRARLRYQAGREIITVTQTVYLFAVQAERRAAEAEANPDVAQVSKVAARIFKYGDKLVLKPRRRRGPAVSGAAGTAAPPESPWFAGLKWWARPGRIGFHFIKYDGWASAAVKSDELSDNLHWFTEGRNEPRGSAVPQLMAPMPDARAGAVEQIAATWAEMFITAAYQPPSRARYVFLPGDGASRCYLLRMRYQVEDRVITITQSLCIFCLTVERPGPAPDTANDNAEAAKLASKIFTHAEGVKLLEKRRHGRMVEGVAQGPAPAEAPWLRRFRWWCEPGRTGFYFIKTDGKPSPAITGLGIELNRYWFTRPKARKE